MEPEKALLKSGSQGLNEERKRKQPVDIASVISVDERILNYGRFYPGKMLGSNITIGNTSSSDQVI
jgi:hypothetical protein